MILIPMYRHTSKKEYAASLLVGIYKKNLFYLMHAFPSEIYTTKYGCARISSESPHYITNGLGHKYIERMQYDSSTDVSSKR